ncbi:MAG: ABC transporter permease [Anaerolineae bacterium]|nr:ABC transporter permease [Anaerolineae bacterium]
MAVSSLGAISEYHELLFAWASRTIRARYQQSVLGGLWAVLQPAATVAIFTIIFTQFIPIDMRVPYVIFAYTAMVPWTFFAASISDMGDSLIINMNLVSKIYFPRQILPIAALLARLMDFCIAGSILVLLMIYYQVPFFALGWLFIPFILITQMVLALGIGLTAAALNVFYRDVKHLIGLGLQLWLYATPIVYPIDVVPERFLPFYFLNPMVGIIEAYRAIVLRAELPGPYIFISVGIATVVFIFGYWFFKRVESQFADLV